MKLSLLILSFLAICAIAMAVDIAFKDCSASGTPIIKTLRIHAEVYPPVPGTQFCSIVYTEATNTAVFTDASFDILTKISGINVDRQQGNVCERFIECPFSMEKGDTTEIKMCQDFPASAPSGKYTVKTTITDAKSNQLSCALIEFQL